MYERPFVLHFSTMTIDGRIASATGYSILSCKFDKLRLYLLRGMVNAVMVGASTVNIDNPRLARRIGDVKPYYRVVVDGRLSTSPNARVYNDTSVPTIVFTGGSAPREKIEELRRRGVEVVVVGEGHRVNLGDALRILLENYGVKRVLVEGGGVLAHSLHRERLVDELRVTIAPVLFAAGRSIVDDPEGRGFTEWPASPRLSLECHEVCPCGHCIHLVYRVRDAQCCPVSTPPPRCLADRILRAARL
ncbi:bifunctional deaminase-reductase domain protein [Pyrolobus fumarii 1A]|uniref:Bifunctional deaminase-reductase domain protein n=1 Tax=Pyrolobus fumarii (strain DSM 11204 / 1A) TaxID=694429 RepID=G0EG18_PYRF1|nr:dihydrofolate reductase family protein [Pyrolobus fumarii]AEM38266.1 bifunctional deaminase-reductase domain protein [Pyrolobus fumarii 1A]